MKKRLTKKEMIEKRNSDFEIDRRLTRVHLLSVFMSNKLHFNYELQDKLKGGIPILFSYFADDVSYVSNELRKRKMGG